jgi:hypothetical protein
VLRPVLSLNEKATFYLQSESTLFACVRSLIQAQILLLNTQEIFRCPAQFVCSNKSKHFCKREDVTHENRVYTLLCAQYWSAGKHVHYLELHIQIARQKVPEEMETELWFEPTRA